MTLALDSSTLIEVMRDHRVGFRDTYRRARERGEPLVVPVVVLHELVSGAAMGGDPRGERQKITRVLTGIGIVPLEADDIEFTAGVRSRLKESGRSIGDIDTLIAGQALARGWTVVTHNVKHFGRVEGLPLIDWAVGSEPLSRAMIAARVGTAS